MNTHKSHDRPIAPLENSSPLLLQAPRFILIPFFGTPLRAIQEGDETWYVREDVFKALSLHEGPYWNRRLFTNQRRTVLIRGRFGNPARLKLVSEAGFYKLLCLSKENGVGNAFNLEGGTLIYDMPRPDEDFDLDQREFFRRILRDIHAGWWESESPVNTDSWGLKPRPSKSRVPAHGR